MAYKNQKKNKEHVKSLQRSGWREGRRISKRYDRLMASFPGNYLSTKEKEDILRRRGLI